MPLYRSLITDYASWHRELWAFVDARDVAIAHRLALEVNLKNSHEAFYISGQHNWTGREGHALIIKFRPEVRKISANAAGAESLISCDKARRLLGYEPKIRVRRGGLTLRVAWHRDQQQ